MSASRRVRGTPTKNKYEPRAQNNITVKKCISFWCFATSKERMEETKETFDLE